MLIAEVTARLSVAAALVETDGYRAELAEEAVRLARSTGDPAALGSALAALCDARSGPDHCRARLDWAGEIVALARTADDPVLELLGRRLRLVALWETGDLAAGDAEISAFDALARVLRRPLYGWYAPLWRGARALLEGRREDCRRELAETGAVGRRAGSANAAMLAATQHWCLLAAEGDTEGLARLIEGSPPLEREPGVWPKVALALLAAQFGRTEEAARRLAAVAPALPAAPRDSEWLPMLAQAAETVGLLGAHPVARQVAGPLRAALAPYAGLFAVEGIGAAVRGPVDHHLALLAAAAGDRGAADRHAAAARTLAAAAGMPDPAPTPAPAPEAESSEAAFRFDGGRWLLRYGGREAGLPDSKGLRDLAVLLARPGTPVPPSTSPPRSDGRALTTPASTVRPTPAS
ncbi:hypothetical protein ACFQ1I_37950 [Kitasatospora arboriphila]